MSNVRRSVFLCLLTGTLSPGECPEAAACAASSPLTEVSPFLSLLAPDSGEGNQPRETKAKRMPKAPTAMKAPRQEIAPATPATARGAIAMPRLPPTPCRPSTRCLLYTSDAADDLTRVDLGGRRII